MTKTPITTTLDTELVVEARAKGIRFSEEFNNHLKALLEMVEEDTEKPIEDRIVTAKARVMSLEAEKERIKKERDKNITFRKEL